MRLKMANLSWPKSLSALLVGSGVLVFLFWLSGSIGGGTAQTGGTLPSGPPENGVFFTKQTPDGPNDKELAQLKKLKQAATYNELQTTVGPDTKVIVLDKSAFTDTSASFLNEELRNGVALIALNVSLVDLANRSSFVQAVSADRLNTANPSSVPNLDGATVSSVPYYSFVSKTVDGADYRGWDMGSKNFSDHLFLADLGKFLAGAFNDIKLPR